MQLSFPIPMCPPEPDPPPCECHKWMTHKKTCVIMKIFSIAKLILEFFFLSCVYSNIDIRKHGLKSDCSS